MDNSLKFSPIEEIIKEISSGRLVIVTDDPTRENEADLVGSAEMITAKSIAFMASQGRGLICAPITSQRAHELDLQQMARQNREALKTAFTISIDAAEGITTGISAADRALTIKNITEADVTAQDFVQPGHVFPLVANDGGVLRRAGHTEAAVDLAKLAGKHPSGVICEIMHENGEMARVGELGEYQQKHNLKACTISQLIAYRSKNEKLVNCTEVINLPTDYGDFDCHLYEVESDGSHHLALVKGEISAEQPTLVRVHSECLTGDAFLSQRCDCGGQLSQALKQISEQGGVLLYLRQEGRGIGLPAKIKAYKLQQQGYDTIQANKLLGYGEDMREYGMGAQILQDLGVTKIKLLTNNPKKLAGLEGYNLEIVEQIQITTVPNQHNACYLQTKKDKMGHDL